MLCVELRTGLPSTINGPCVLSDQPFPLANECFCAFHAQSLPATMGIVASQLCRPHQVCLVVFAWYITQLGYHIHVTSTRCMHLSFLP